MDASVATIQQVYTAWVQAIGSVVGITVAIYVPYRQRKDDMRMREFQYWSNRADVERRILLVAGDLGKFVQRLIDESKPTVGATRLRTYYPTLHKDFLDRLDVLESRDVGDDGHDRIAMMRAVLKRLMSLYPGNTSAPVPPGSPFSRELEEGPIGQDAKACVDETSEKLETARSKVTQLGKK